MTSWVAVDQISFVGIYSDALVGSIQPVAPDLSLIGPTIYGDYTDQTPVAASPANHYPGYFQQAINSFLYGRIYLVPGVLALGNLVSAQTRPFGLWNATFTTHDVQALIETDTAGLDLTQPIAIPYTLQPLQEVDYSVGVSLDGPASLDARYDFIIDSVTYSLEVTGNRVVIWPFGPNWATPVNESVEFMTDVLRAYDGSSKRAALRLKARRRLDYQFQVTRTNTQHFDNILFGWQNRSFAVPYWQYQCKLTSAASIGGSALALNTIDAGFAAGETLAVFRDIETYEVLEILAVTSTNITLKSPLSLAWPVGSAVYPCAVSNLETNIPVSRYTSSVLTGQCSFIASPTTTDPFLPDETATDIYNGHEVILRQPNWANSLANDSDYARDVIDYSTGDRGYAITETIPKLTKAYSWTFKSRRQAAAWRAFLQRCRGRQVPVYIPSWHEDFTLTANVTTGAVALTVRDRNFFNLVGANPARAHIMIRTRYNGNFFRPIASVGKTGNDLNIGITTPLGVALTPADIIGIHYVGLHCFAADRQTLQWQTDGVAVLETVFELVAA